VRGGEAPISLDLEMEVSRLIDTVLYKLSVNVGGNGPRALALTDSLRLIV
jgi:hypothetical protein